MPGKPPSQNVIVIDESASDDDVNHDMSRAAVQAPQHTDAPPHQPQMQRQAPRVPHQRQARDLPYLPFHPLSSRSRHQTSHLVPGLLKPEMFEKSSAPPLSIPAPITSSGTSMPATAPSQARSQAAAHILQVQPQAAAYQPGVAPGTGSMPIGQRLASTDMGGSSASIEIPLQPPALTAIATNHTATPAAGVGLFARSDIRPELKQLSCSDAIRDKIRSLLSSTAHMAGRVGASNQHYSNELGACLGQYSPTNIQQVNAELCASESLDALEASLSQMQQKHDKMKQLLRNQNHGVTLVSNLGP